MPWNVVLRWTARVWSIASILFILAFVVGGRESFRPTVNEAVGLLLFPFGVMAGLVIAWRRQGAGGLMAVASLILFYLWMFARDGRFPTGPYFLLLTAPGFLHLASALLTRSRSMGTQSETT